MGGTAWGGRAAWGCHDESSLLAGVALLVQARKTPTAEGALMGGPAGAPMHESLGPAASGRSLEHSPAGAPVQELDGSAAGRAMMGARPVRYTAAGMDGPAEMEGTA